MKNLIWPLSFQVRHLIFVGTLALVTLWLCAAIPTLGQSNFGALELDELFAVARLRSGHLSDNLRNGLHPPLNHFLLFLWTSINDSEVWIRLFAIFAGAIAVGALYYFLTLSFGPLVSWVVTLSVVFGGAFHLSTLGVLNYALPTALVAIVYCLSELQIKNSSIHNLLCLGACSFLASLAHYGTLLAILPIWVGLGLRFLPGHPSRARQLLRVCACWLAPFVMWLLYHRSLLNMGVAGYLEPYLFRTSDKTVLQFWNSGIEYYAARTLFPTFSVTTFYLGMGAFFAVLGIQLRRDRSRLPELTQAIFFGVGPLIAQFVAGLMGFYPWGFSRYAFFLPLSFSYVICWVLSFIQKEVASYLEQYGLMASKLFRSSIVCGIVALASTLCFYWGNPPERWDPVLLMGKRDVQMSRLWREAVFQQASKPETSLILVDIHTFENLWWYTLPEALRIYVGMPQPEGLASSIHPKMEVLFDRYSLLDGSSACTSALRRLNEGEVLGSVIIAIDPVDWTMDSFSVEEFRKCLQTSSRSFEFMQWGSNLLALSN